MNVWQIKSAALIVAAASILFALPAAAGLVRQLDGGQLVGATGVVFDGREYSIALGLDGSCTTLFDGCTDPSDFPFPDQSQAVGFMQVVEIRFFSTLQKVSLIAILP